MYSYKNLPPIIKDCKTINNKLMNDKLREKLIENIIEWKAKQ
jgi:hypothetical protein